MRQFRWPFRRPVRVATRGNDHRLSPGPPRGSSRGCSPTDLASTPRAKRPHLGLPTPESASSTGRTAGSNSLGQGNRADLDSIWLHSRAERPLPRLPLSRVCQAPGGAWRLGCVSRRRAGDQVGWSGQLPCHSARSRAPFVRLSGTSPGTRQASGRPSRSQVQQVAQVLEIRWGSKQKAP